MESGGGETNYWPGFVDALSNVVLTLVFVLVIFVFALVMASNKVEEKLKQMATIQKSETVEMRQLDDAQKQIAILQQKLDVAQNQIKQVETRDVSSDIHENKDITVQQKVFDKQTESTSVTEKNKNKISLIFPESTSDLDEASIAEFSKALGEVQKDIKAQKILIRSIQGNEPFTAAQRLAYYRVLSIRNYLMSVQGVNAANISSVIVKPDVAEAGRVEILFLHE